MRTRHENRTCLDTYARWSGVILATLVFAFAANAACKVTGRGASCTVDVDGDGRPEIVVEQCADGNAVCGCRVEVDGTGVITITGCGGCGSCV